MGRTSCEIRWRGGTDSLLSPISSIAFQKELLRCPKLQNSSSLVKPWAVLLVSAVSAGAGGLIWQFGAHQSVVQQHQSPSCFNMPGATVGSMQFNICEQGK
jgi:hypothetical protein